MVGGRIFQATGLAVEITRGAAPIASLIAALPGFEMPDGSLATAAGSLSPLILFAASPGTITGVITLSTAHYGHELPVNNLFAIVVVVGVTWIALMLSARVSGEQTKGGLLRDTLTRFMGLIVLAIGVQFALTGFQAVAGSGRSGG